MKNLKNNKIINIKNLRSKLFLKANIYKLRADKAFVSMIALLLANVFLVIGLSIFGIAMREVILSSGARESLFAFYAADGGMECALYWDIHEDNFSNTAAPLSNINCSGQDVAVSFNQDCGANCSRNNFSLSYPSGACVQVDIYKLNDDDTLIKSFGQNTCDPNNKKRVERAWQVTY
ncbi:pilus assembly PilX N-terminal domain-containing protein [Patescibacteria group bacterium]|nr:pilus assembly PilX N-terminal domain-containing protein [Patescibacteria group bacterium]